MPQRGARVHGNRPLCRPQDRQHRARGQDHGRREKDREIPPLDSEQKTRDQRAREARADGAGCDAEGGQKERSLRDQEPDVRGSSAERRPNAELESPPRH